MRKCYTEGGSKVGILARRLLKIFRLERVTIAYGKARVKTKILMQSRTPQKPIFGSRSVYIAIIALLLIPILFWGQKQRMTTDHKTVRILDLTPAMDRAGISRKLKEELFDILVIGGGATGAGVALDAANKGLKVALVERFDFASGTSSKSTKLLHGGVRYLEKAVLNMDKQQYDLVLEGLTERENLFTIAPHLTKPIEIITPIYSWWETPYYWSGLKIYDLIASSSRLPESRYLLASEVVEKIPFLRTDGLTGGVAYYDGQFNDTRLNITLIKSAIALGGIALNYAEVENLKINSNGIVSGATVYDTIAKEKFEINARIVINATGPYVDAIRKMDTPEATPLIKGSSGTHLVLNKKFLPNNAGLLIPKTKDGRVVFMLPWEQNVLVGTTDNMTDLSFHPYPSKEEMLYLLSYVQEYLNIRLEPSEVKSMWTGIRPLVQSSNVDDTASLVRDYFIEESKSSLITIAGGKWTTFRKMGEDVVKRAEKQLGKEENDLSTTQLRLIGYKGWNADLTLTLMEQFGITEQTAGYLVSSYGSIAQNILENGKGKSLNTLLVAGHPMLLSEIQWALEEEMVQKPMDILARRMRLATVDAMAAKSILPLVMKMMQEYFGWDGAKTSVEMDEALSELNRMTVPSL